MHNYIKAVILIKRSGANIAALQRARSAKASAEAGHGGIAIGGYGSCPGGGDGVFSGSIAVTVLDAQSQQSLCTP